MIFIRQLGEPVASGLVPDELARPDETVILLQEICHRRAAGIFVTLPRFRFEEITGSAQEDRAICKLVPAHANEDFFHTFVASDGLAGKFEAFFVVATYGRTAQHYRTQTASTVFITFRRRYGRDDIDIEQFAERPVRLHVEELFGASLHVAEILAVLHFAVGISIAHEHEVDSVALGSPLIDSHFALLGIIAGHIEVRFWQIRIVIRSHYLPVRLPSVVGRIQLV